MQEGPENIALGAMMGMSGDVKRIKSHPHTVPQLRA
jgi:hypothetical protein